MPLPLCYSHRASLTDAHLASLGSLRRRRAARNSERAAAATVLYAGLFLISGSALLAITYLLVRAASTTTAVHAVMTAGGPRPVGPVEQHSLDLHHQLVASLVALGAMTLISAALGWLVAGRVLSPIRTMTLAARRISEDNLAERLDVRGPDDELKLLGDTIDQLIARLQAAFESQRRFVANAAHELRTPLATMRASLDVAAAKPEPPPHITALEQRFRAELARLRRCWRAYSRSRALSTDNSRTTQLSRSARSPPPRSTATPTRSLIGAWRSLTMSAPTRW